METTPASQIFDTIKSPLGIPNITTNGLINLIIQIIFGAGIALTVIYLVISGIRFITAGGDSEKIKGARSSFLNVIIGFIIIILTFAIIGLVANFFGISTDSLYNLIPDSLRP